jgi:DNA-binding GntR family transcriptional regulator
MLQLVKETLAEQAYKELRNRIVLGAFPVGKRLLPEELSQMLSISQTPVKEALVMLEHDGLVEVASRRGALVRRFSPREIEDLYDARLMVESHAITQGYSAGSITADFVAHLSECAARYTARSQRRTRNDMVEALRFDMQLHARLVSLAGNDLITVWHERLLRQTQLLRAYSLKSYDAGNVARAQRDHDAIVAGFVAGSCSAVVDALAAHFRQSRENVISRY